MNKKKGERKNEKKWGDNDKNKNRNNKYTKKKWKRK